MKHVSSICLCALLLSALFSCLNQLPSGVPPAASPNSIVDDFFDAIRDNDTARVTDLLNQDSSLLERIVTREDGQGVRQEQTPLMYAAQLGHASLVSLLVEQGAQMNQATSSGSTPLMIATQAGHQEVVAYLQEKARIEFVQAIRAGNLARVSKAVEDEGVDIHAFYSTDSGERFTPLQVAALNGQKSIVELFVSHDSTSIDIRTEEGNFTALHLAARKNQRAVVRILIEHGVDKNAQNDAGMTPLHIAAQKGLRRMVEVLVDQGVDIHVPNREGTTAVYLAHQGGHQKIEEYLLAQGAHLETADNLTAGTGRRNDDGTSGSGRRNDDGTSGTGRRNDDGTSGTGRRNDDGTSGSGRRNDDGTTGTGRRDDDGTSGSGRRNDDGTTGTGRRNDDGTSI